MAQYYQYLMQECCIFMSLCHLVLWSFLRVGKTLVPPEQVSLKSEIPECLVAIFRGLRKQPIFGDATTDFPAK